MNCQLRLVLCIAALVMAGRSVAAPGELDTSFALGNGKVLATTDMLIGTGVALGITGSAVLGGITFPAGATLDQGGTHTSRDIRKFVVSQCGMVLP